MSAVTADAVIYMPFAELVDIEKERERLKKEEERLTKELARVNGMLSNERFMSKAPEAKVQEEREKASKIYGHDGAGERTTGSLEVTMRIMLKKQITLKKKGNANNCHGISCLEIHSAVSIRNITDPKNVKLVYGSSNFFNVRSALRKIS